MSVDLKMRHVNVVRYITPLREGGSLPAIVECSDDFLYVLKFKGAGQGTNALVAEVIGTAIARLLDLNAPELVTAYLSEDFGRTEADEEIQDLLKFSVGDNLGVHYLKGSVTYDRNTFVVPEHTASKIVWLDAFLMNVDRTYRNTNMLIWNKELWVIDNGAALYFHHTWHNWKEVSEKPFVQIKDHVLIKDARQVKMIHNEIVPKITDVFLNDLLSSIPDVWLTERNDVADANEARSVYFNFLKNRLANSSHFLNEIENAGK